MPPSASSSADASPIFHIAVARIASVPVAAAELDAMLCYALEGAVDVPLAPLAAQHALRLARIVAAR